MLFVALLLSPLFAASELDAQDAIENPPREGDGNTVDQEAADQEAADQEEADQEAADKVDKAKADKAAKRKAAKKKAAKEEADSEDESSDSSETTDGPQLAEFLDPDPLGFDLSTFGALSEGVELAVDTVTSAFNEFNRATVLGRLKLSSPFQLLVFFLITFVLLDRRARHLRRELWDMVPPLATPLLDNLLDSALRVLARTLPVALVLMPAYFPLKGIFPEATWLILVTRLLWLILIYRAIQTTADELLIGQVIDFEHKPVRLQRWFKKGLIVVLATWTVMTFVEIVDYRHDTIALMAFGLKVFGALYALRLFALKDELLSLLPEGTETSLVNPELRKTFSSYTYSIIGLSVLLMVLWAAGFSTAAKFILIRTYALVAIVLVTLWVYRRVQQTLRKFIEKQNALGGDVDLERQKVLRAMEHSTAYAGGFLLIWIVLSVIGAWDLLIRVASIPLFKPSESLTISVYVIAKAVVIFYLFIFASRLIRVVLNEKLYPKFEVEVGVGYAINVMAHYLFFVMGLLFGIKSFGLDLSAVMIFFSALGIGIGFGLQDIVNNLISGFILLFGRSIKKGDYVTAGETYGRVDSVGARSVTLTTPDNYELVIPSSAIVSNSIINWTLTSPFVRNHIEVGVSYKSDVQQVKEVLLEAIKAYPQALKRPRPEVWLESFGDSAVNFTLLFYIDLRRTNAAQVRGEINYIIWGALAAAHVEIPFPQRDLHLRSDFDMAELEARLLQKLLAAQAPHPAPPEVDDEPETED